MTTTFDTSIVPVSGSQELRITSVIDESGRITSVLVAVAWPETPAWPLGISHINIAPAVVGAVAAELSALADRIATAGA